MSLNFLLPWGLLALAAWLVPLLIHLVRRPEQTPYDFPALRWLRESERPRRRLRLEHLGLLALRLLLIALMASLLAIPVLRGDWRDARHWILASTAIDLAAARATVSDTGAQWRWLAPGFPAIDDARPASGQPTSSLVREFEASLPSSDSLTVLVAEEPDGLDAERIALGRTVEWVAVSAADVVVSEPGGNKPLLVALRHTGDAGKAQGYLRAALAALGADEPNGLQVDDKPTSVAVDAASDAVIWLGEELPDELLPWIQSGGRALLIDPQSQDGSIILRDEAGYALASEQTLGSGAIVRLLRPMTPDSLPMLLDAGFPRSLRSLLEGAAAPPTRAMAAEVSPRLVERAEQPTTTPLTGLLCLLLALVFLLERIVAMRRRQAA